jgi:hypothetical protein
MLGCWHAAALARRDKYSDAMGQDRVLILMFADDVLARDVNVKVLDRTVD